MWYGTLYILCIYALCWKLTQKVNLGPFWKFQCRTLKQHLVCQKRGFLKSESMWNPPKKLKNPRKFHTLFSFTLRAVESLIVNRFSILRQEFISTFQGLYFLCYPFGSSDHWKYEKNSPKPKIPRILTWLDCVFLDFFQGKNMCSKKVMSCKTVHWNYLMLEF